MNKVKGRILYERRLKKLNESSKSPELKEIWKEYYKALLDINQARNLTKDERRVQSHKALANRDMELTLYNAEIAERRKQEFKEAFAKEGTGESRKKFDKAKRQTEEFLDRESDVEVEIDYPPLRPTPLQVRRAKYARRRKEARVPSTDVLQEPMGVYKAKRLRRKKLKSGKRRSNAAVAIHEIRKLQRSTEFLIPKTAINRYVRDIAVNYNADIRFQKVAMDALQAGVEAYLISILEDSYQCAIHVKRITLMDKDIKLVRTIRRIKDSNA